VTEPRRSWYGGGLRFSCHQCGNCCRGSQPGWVYLSAFRIERLARLLGTGVRAFRRDFVTEDENGETVLRLQSNGDCIFWKDGCTVYPERPRQCRSFPFWSENLQSRERWTELKEFCHGVDQGRLYPVEEIRAIFKGRPT
jgi:Fe-S-cluster containining protein